MCTCRRTPASASAHSGLGAVPLEVEEEDVVSDRRLGGAALDAGEVDAPRGELGDDLVEAARPVAVEGEGDAGAVASGGLAVLPGQQEEPGGVLGRVLDGGGEDGEAVALRGAAAAHGGEPRLLRDPAGRVRGGERRLGGDARAGAAAGRPSTGRGPGGGRARAGWRRGRRRRGPAGAAPPAARSSCRMRRPGRWTRRSSVAPTAPSIEFSTGRSATSTSARQGGLVGVGEARERLALGAGQRRTAGDGLLAEGSGWTQVGDAHGLYLPGVREAVSFAAPTDRRPGLVESGLTRCRRWGGPVQVDRRVAAAGPPRGSRRARPQAPTGVPRRLPGPPAAPALPRPPGRLGRPGPPPGRRRALPAPDVVQAALRVSLHRRPALREPERGCGAGLLRRRHDRGDPGRTLRDPRPPGDGTDHDLRAARPDAGCPGDRPEARGDVHPRGQRAARRDPDCG